MGPMGLSFDFVVFVFAHVTTTLLGRQGRLAGVHVLYLMDYISVVFKCMHFVLGQWKGGHKLNSRVIQTERRSQLDSRGVQKERSFETQLSRVFVDPSNESVARIKMKYGVTKRLFVLLTQLYTWTL
jgi:hypothetical protein